MNVSDSSGMASMPGPDTELATERLRLSPPHGGLAEALTRALNASYVLHRPFLDWARPDWTVAESRQRLGIAKVEFATFGRERRYYLLDKTGADVIGCVGLQHRPQHCEVGYWANVLYARQGYLREALELLLAPFGANQLMLTTSSANLPSQKLAAALGFNCRESRPRDGAGEGESTLVYWR